MVRICEMRFHNLYYGMFEATEAELLAAVATGLVHPQTAFQMACDDGWLKSVTALLCDSRVDPSAYMNAGLRRAGYYGHAAVVRALLADGRVDPTLHESNGVSSASCMGHVAVVWLLLADGRAEHKAAVHAAREYKQPIVLRGCMGHSAWFGSVR